MTKYILTKHAQEEMAIRGIPESILDVVMQTPGEVVPEKEELVAYQSVISFPEGPMLLRAIVADQDQPMRIITVYRTSKMEKYWRGS
jgi:hypothetical protein